MDQLEAEQCAARHGKVTGSTRDGSAWRVKLADGSVIVVPECAAELAAAVAGPEAIPEPLGAFVRAIASAIAELGSLAPNAVVPLAAGELDVGWMKSYRTSPQVPFRPARLVVTPGYVLERLIFGNHYVSALAPGGWPSELANFLEIQSEDGKPWVIVPGITVEVTVSNPAKYGIERPFFAALLGYVVEQRPYGQR